jgi:hypothetical protein
VETSLLIRQDRVADAAIMDELSGRELSAS